MSSALVMNQSVSTDKKKVLKVVGFAALFALALWAMLMPQMALAAGDASLGLSHADDFNDIWHTIVGWTQGSLGRVIAGTMILVGIIGGIARQSLMAFAIGIAGGMGLTYAPNIIESVLGASIENASTATLAAMQLVNGLGM